MPQRGQGSRFLTHPETGESKTIAEWARAIGVTHEAIRQRLKNGWSVADAITTPGKPKEDRAYSRIRRTQHTPENTPTPSAATRAEHDGMSLRDLARARRVLSVEWAADPLAGPVVGWALVRRLAALDYDV